MLLFLLREGFGGQLPRQAPKAAGSYTGELLVSGLVLSAWCALRFVATRGEYFAVDVVLATPCLALGIWVSLRSGTALAAGRVRRRAKALRAARRGHRQSLRARRG
jgi:hypothetical protein